jgi:hypothetical protein
MYSSWLAGAAFPSPGQPVPDDKTRRVPLASFIISFLHSTLDVERCVCFSRLKFASRLNFHLKGGSKDQLLRKTAKSRGCALAPKPKSNDLKL